MYNVNTQVPHEKLLNICQEEGESVKKFINKFKECWMDYEEEVSVKYKELNMGDLKPDIIFISSCFYKALLPQYRHVLENEELLDLSEALKSFITYELSCLSKKEMEEAKETTGKSLEKVVKDVKEEIKIHEKKQD